MHHQSHRTRHVGFSSSSRSVHHIISLIIPHVSSITFMLLLFVTTPVPTAARIFISEFMASNATTAHDNDFYDYSDWVELFNDDSIPIDISGYFLSDDLSEQSKWRFPEGTTIPSDGTLLIWLDSRDTVLESLHASFKLSADGETVTLTSPDGSLVDSVAFMEQHTDVSMGRNDSREEQWLLFGVPTPGFRNGNDGIKRFSVAPEVQFSTSGGIKTGPFSLELSASGTIFYTTDCSVPTKAGTPYTTPIHIDSTTVIRARTFQNEAVPGPVTTRTYIFDYTSTLPVFSIVTDSSHLWDDSSGIYCTGVNGVQINEGWGGEPANYNRQWERPINIEMYDSDGSACFNQTAGIRIQGEYVRLMAQKPFSIYGRGRYSGAFNHQFFPDKPITIFNNFILRPGGNDWVCTMFNEGAINRIISPAMDLDIQAYRPSVLFLNGEYWGLYNIREKVNEDYLLHNYGLSADKVDVLENLQGEIRGSNESWLSLRNDIADRDMSDDSNFQIIKDNIDINEFINYIITEVYFVNTDWPACNIRFWQHRNGEGKWRWILAGIDLGFANNLVDYNSLKRIIDTTAMPDKYILTGTILIRKCLENDSFRHRFIQLFSHHLSSTFDSTRVVHIINDLKNVIAPEMPGQIARWKDATDNGILPIPSFEKWNDNYVEWMITFGHQRPDIQRTHLAEQFHLDSAVNMNISMTGKRGRVFVYETPMTDSSKTTRFYKNIPISLTAEPYPGYTFKGWKGISQNPTITVTLSGDTVLYPLFISDKGTVLPDTIFSDMMLTPNGGPYFVTTACVIDSPATLSCTLGVEIRMAPDATLRVHGSLRLSGSLSAPVTISRTEKNSEKPWGAIILDNAAAPSTFRYVTISGAGHGPHPDSERAALTILNSTATISHCCFDEVPAPIHVSNSTVTIDSSQFASTATGDLVHIMNSDSARITNCRFIGNGFFDTDAIDLDNVRNGIINNNTLSNFTGFNSDGIDLGEGSKNIFVSGNHIIHCADKGISIGQSSTADISDNTISDCAIGIGIKDLGSSAIITNDNFCYNDTDIAVFEKNDGAGGGSARISNCVFFETESNPLYVDGYSEVSVAYSICTTKKLNGIGNCKDQPQFANPPAGDYTIPPASPCRTMAGNSPHPIIGTSRRYDTAEQQSPIISEIHYQPRQGASYEFIELFNPCAEPIDIGGYWLSRAVSFTFPDSTFIGSGKCIIISRDGEVYRNDNYASFEWSSGKLANEGESIILRDRLGKLVDYVSYTPSRFPQVASDGSSLELASPANDNADILSWLCGAIDGTPGTVSYNIPVIPEKSSLKTGYSFKRTGRNAILHFTLPGPSFVSVSLYTIKGQRIKRIFNENLKGLHPYAAAIPLGSLGQGMYLLSFHSSYYSFNRKISVVRR